MNEGLRIQFGRKAVTRPIGISPLFRNQYGPKEEVVKFYSTLQLVKGINIIAELPARPVLIAADLIGIAALILPKVLK